MSRGITVTLLTGVLLTACLTSRGCGRRRAPDYTWHDSAGNRITQKWKTDAAGQFVLDPNGRKIPEPHPYDSYGNAWVYDSSGSLVPPAPPAGSSSGSSRSGFFWGGSGYRSSGSSSYSTSSSSSSSSSSSATSRGGFGASASSHSSSS